MRFILIFASVIFFAINSFAQCGNILASGNCNTGTIVTNNATLVNGNYRFPSGTATFANGLNYNLGGSDVATLRICGNLTLNALNITSNGNGQVNIIIESGGTLTLGGSGTLNLNGRVNITNYGTLNINRNVNMQGNFTYISNATSSAVLNMASNTLELVNNNSSFINNGDANIGTLRIQSNNGSVCLGPFSTTQLTNLINLSTNSVVINPSNTSACFGFTGNANMNNALSNNSNLTICKATGATQSGSLSGNAAFGSAIVLNNCTSCKSLINPLPVSLIEFKHTTAGENSVVLEWITASETNNAYFEVERSNDGFHFDIISEKIPGTNGNSMVQYHWEDTRPISGTAYYRLRQTDFNGEFSVSEIIYVSVAHNSTHEVSVFPNPSAGTVNVQFSGMQNPLMEVFNCNGQKVMSKIISAAAEGTTQSFDFSSFQKGIYLISWSEGAQIVTKKLVLH
jgi:hypothetical protein